MPKQRSPQKGLCGTVPILYCTSTILGILSIGLVIIISEYVSHILVPPIQRLPTPTSVLSTGDVLFPSETPCLATDLTDLNVKTIEYDSRHNRIRIVDQFGGVTMCFYNEQDNLIEFTNILGNTTTYQYDSNGKLQFIITSSGNVVDLRRP